LIRKFYVDQRHRWWRWKEELDKDAVRQGCS
jgi:hypothetical protein